jgi:TonB family protein
MQNKRPTTKDRSPAQKSKRLFLLFLFTSFAIHFLTYVNIQYFSEGQKENLSQKTDKVKIRYVEKKKETDDDKLAKKQVVETPMQKTEKPKEADYLGAQDHIAKEQTKVKNPNTMAMQAGPKGNSDKTASIPPAAKQQLKIAESENGKRPAAKERREKMKQLLPSAQEMFGQVNAGYQDYIEDDLQEGDVVDLNTTNFRFLGYVTHLRQAIQLVWTYPQEAAMRGLEGKVLLQFRIKKDGTTEQVKVVQSSGYTVLDQSIVSAIKLASPFAPLPNDVQGESKVFAGVFHYTLSGMYRAH